METATAHRLGLEGLRPEGPLERCEVQPLSGPESTAMEHLWLSVASGRRYLKAILRPVLDACGCTVVLLNVTGVTTDRPWTASL